MEKEKLSNHEREARKLWRRGLSSYKIADIMGYSPFWVFIKCRDIKR